MSNPTNSGNPAKGGNPKGRVQGRADSSRPTKVTVPETISGAQVDLSTIRYKISTKDMEKFVQTALDATIMAFNERLANGGKLDDNDDRIPCEPCIIHLNSAVESDKCLPLMVTLPRTVEIGDKRKKQNVNNNRRGTIDILQTSAYKETAGAGGHARIHSAIFKFFDRWLYDPDEIQSMKFKHTYDMTSKAVGELLKVCTIKKTKFKGDSDYSYWFAIDPYYVVYNMLKWKYVDADGNIIEDKRPYKTNICVHKNTDKKSKGNYIYYVDRILTNGSSRKNKGGDNIDSMHDYLGSTF